VIIKNIVLFETNLDNYMKNLFKISTGISEMPITQQKKHFWRFLG